MMIPKACLYVPAVGALLMAALLVVGAITSNVMVMIVGMAVGASFALVGMAIAIVCSILYYKGKL